MTTTPADDPVLVRFREALDEIDGRQIERVVLFGSRARGGARPDSDDDVAVFLTDPGAVISAKPFPAGAYREPLPLMQEIPADGLDL
jgi:hypothetical protein